MSLCLPISVKGVLIEDGAVVLLENGRDEWELPGGRLEPDESPEDCVAREFMEELGAAVLVGPILSSWVYEPLPDRRVFLVAYHVSRSDPTGLTVSAEHRRAKWWPLTALPDDRLPNGYARAITMSAASAHRGVTAPQPNTAHPIRG